MDFSMLNEMILWSCLVPMIIPVVMVSMFIYYRLRTSKLDEVWSQFAAEHDLEYTKYNMLPGLPWPKKIEGTWNGIDIKIRHFNEHVNRRGFTRSKYTSYKCPFPELSDDLELSEDDSILSIFFDFGMDIGDDRFDDVFVVESYDPEPIRTFLNQPEVKEELLSLHENGYSPSIRHDGLQLRHDDLADDQETLARYAERLTECCQVLRSNHSEDEPEEHSRFSGAPPW